MPLLGVNDQPLPLPRWTQWIRFEQIAPEKNRFRQYSITIDRNLLGEWVVTCSWGRTGGRQRMRAIFLASRDEALVLAEKIAHRRLLRGYQVSAFE